jgi:hypothetical protein
MIPTTPRVVGYYQLNPTGLGIQYTQAELNEVARVLKGCNIPIIEDLAHALVLYDGDSPSCPSFLNSISEIDGLNLFSLVGLSKPFFISDWRIGALICRKVVIDDISRLIQLSVSRIPSLFVTPLLTLFTGDNTKIRAFLHEKWREESGYALQRDIMMYCLTGHTKTTCVNSERKNFCKQIVEKEIYHFLEYCFEKQIPLFGTETTILPSPNDIPSEGGVAQIVANYLANGCSEYLNIIHYPNSGFYLFGDCEKLFDLNILGVQNTKQFYLFLRFWIGVNIIPEEWTGSYYVQGTRLARFSFSITARSIVWNCFLMHILLDQLKNIRHKEISKKI